MINRHNLARQLLIFFIALLIVAVAIIALSTKTYGDQYDEKIKAVQAEIKQYQAQASQLEGQSKSLQEALDQLSKDKSLIQTQIELTQSKYDLIQQQIYVTNRKIKDNRDALGVTIANLYVDSNISTLEMIASSKNISEYLDKQTYRNAIRDQIMQTIGNIRQLEEQLNKQKADIGRTLTDSQNAREALAQKESEQQTLLAKTNGQEAAYQQLVSDKNTEASKLVAEQVAANVRAAKNSGSQIITSDIAGGGGYPAKWANAPRDAVVDDWALYNRECVSYVAWKIASTGRFVPYFNGNGNANQWEQYVARYGISTGDTPVVGSAAVLNTGVYGHVMYVEAVSEDKSRITVSEYNYGWTGLYSKRTLSSAGLRYIYF